MHGNELRLFGAEAFPPYSYYQCYASDIGAVGTTFNVVSYDVVWAEHRALRPSPGIILTSKSNKYILETYHLIVYISKGNLVCIYTFF